MLGIGLVKLSGEAAIQTVDDNKDIRNLFIANAIV
jgi:hypothetical protein